MQTQSPEYQQTYDQHRLVTAGAASMLSFNRIVAWLTNRGISLLGSRVLSVRGRKSGEWRSTPVNLLTVDGVRYLVAPRGHTQWVKNLRSTREGRLRLGRRTDTFHATEIADAMLRHGVYVIAFSFPVVPRGEARIRVQLSAAHTDEDIRTCVRAFTEARDEVG